MHENAACPGSVLLNDITSLIIKNLTAIISTNQVCNAAAGGTGRVFNGLIDDDLSSGNMVY